MTSSDMPASSAHATITYHADTGYSAVKSPVVKQRNFQLSVHALADEGVTPSMLEEGIQTIVSDLNRDKVPPSGASDTLAKRTNDLYFDGTVRVSVTETDGIEPSYIPLPASGKPDMGAYYRGMVREGNTNHNS